MAKFDNQLSRMEYLMGYRMPVNEGKTCNSTIEYSAKGADNNIYGIIKEGTKYYIKKTEDGKQNITESYAYLGGFNSRKENEYKSYNEASKHMELLLMSLNEAYGKNEKTSTFDFNRSSKTYATLTESARIELDRVNQIMENSLGIKNNIGDHGNPEGKGSSTGSETVKNNEPFETKVTPKMENDSIPEETNPAKANSDYTDAKEPKMDSTEMPKGGKTANDNTAAHDDLDGESVVDKTPKGGKAVMVNEDISAEDFSDETYGDDMLGGTTNHNEGVMGDMEIEEPADEFDVEDFGEETPVENEPMDAPEVGNDIVGADDEEDDFDALMEEFEHVLSSSEKEITSGDNEVLTGQGNSSEVLTCDNMEGCPACDTKDESTEALEGPKAGGNAITWDKMNESQKKAINMVVESICNKLIKKEPAKKELTLEEKVKNMVDRIVKEEVNNLKDFGKHPKFGVEPMTTPENPKGDGKKVGTADKDWNHDSAKGSECYGKKIGSSAPFDEVVNMLTDSVMKSLKESSLKKK